MEEELHSKQQQIEEKLREAIRRMEEMKQTGNNVNVALHRQDQALERIDQKLDAIEGYTKQSKKLLSSIGSFWGFLKNRITGWKYKPTQLSTTEVKHDEPVSQSVGSTLPSSSHSADDDMLNELLNQAKEVRSIVTTTNQTLTRQKGKIDQISGKVDRSLNNIGALNTECRRILDK